jgi:hypothetical protein
MQAVATDSVSAHVHTCSLLDNQTRANIAHNGVAHQESSGAARQQDPYTLAIGKLAAVSCENGLIHAEHAC